MVQIYRKLMSTMIKVITSTGVTKLQNMCPSTTEEDRRAIAYCRLLMSLCTHVRHFVCELVKLQNVAKYNMRFSFDEFFRRGTLHLRYAIRNPVNGFIVTQAGKRQLQIRIWAINVALTRR